MRPENSTNRSAAPGPSQFCKEQEAAIHHLAEELGRLMGLHLSKIEQQKLPEANSSAKVSKPGSPEIPGP
jgi:hypothetical protein